MRLNTLSAALATAALLGTVALSALAQPAGPRDRAGPLGPGRVFEQADANHDGRVTWDEAWSFLGSRFASADADHDGGVTREELRAYAAQQMGQRPIPVRAEQRGDAAFRAADADRDGRVTLAEVRPMAEAMFRMADRNGDGAIERAETGPGRRPGPRGDAPPPPAR